MFFCVFFKSDWKSEGESLLHNKQKKEPIWIHNNLLFPSEYSLFIHDSNEIPFFGEFGGLERNWIDIYGSKNSFPSDIYGDIQLRSQPFLKILERDILFYEGTFLHRQRAQPY